MDSLSSYEVIEKHTSHQSIARIDSHSVPRQDFEFKRVEYRDVLKHVKSLKINKASGFDGISPKFVKIAGKSLIVMLVNLFNECIVNCVFPSTLKKADISPLYKKNDSLNKCNYRSVNLLPIISKIFEKIMSEQITVHFTHLLNSSLSAYRQGYSCQRVLLDMTETWRKSLDDGKTIGTVAMDLSRAFDCMPHGLLIAKLHAYGFTHAACDFVMSYLVDRRQRVKTMGAVSSWETINRGVPQGSVLGPILFNIFMNDLFFLDNESKLFNYADDNTLSKSENDESKLIYTLQKDTLACIDWFSRNNLSANQEKFQSMILCKKDLKSNHLNLDGIEIECVNYMKVLGINVDRNLDFREHVSQICAKAGRQLNVLRRLSRNLNFDSRLSIYKSFISSTFNYCPVVWIFCGKGNSNKLEKNNERAIRIVFDDRDSSYEELLKKAKLLPLSMLRLKYMIIEVYKCIRRQNPEYLNDSFKIMNSKYEFRDTSKAIQPNFNSMTFGYRSFAYYGAKLWNHLPTTLKLIEDIQIFKLEIHKWLLESDPKELVIC